MLAPARTSPEVIARLNRDLVGLLKTNEVKEQLFVQGVDAMWSTPEEFGAYIKAETAKWAKVIKAASVKVD